MGFFYSPIKLIELAKESTSIATKFKKGKSADWFLSKEGETAYNKAKTPAERTVFYFNYLLALKQNEAANRDVLYRIAYVLQNSVEKASLEYSRYPNILDSTKDPIINAVKTKNLNVNCTNGDYSIYGLLLLSAIHNELEVEKFYQSKYKPYERITYCEKDGSVSDLYKIERDIIGAFCSNYSGQYMPPYIYDIFKNANTEDESDDESDDEEEER